MWLGSDNTTATWEPESTLSQQLIDEYEAGVSREVYDITHSGGGQIVHTLASECVKHTWPSPKSLKQDTSYMVSTASG